MVIGTPPFIVATIDAADELEAEELKETSGEAIGIAFLSSLVSRLFLISSCSSFILIFLPVDVTFMSTCERVRPSIVLRVFCCE